nr:immunoglobulin heavy chain junction region [Macaca mulatta]MOV48805.1 immunoglobulin heavy chain junction region [Macaca mulatta]MOV48847.1 immunoglobulin heavy chain junction region [Macaca mulatta]MOV48911.1 immunoglobulin heavy chain junction region [Macaca mulatta]MOV48922.1 immunoglobulin heavy chain junction region [Macaca mulatta]
CAKDMGAGQRLVGTFDWW